jgi:molybdenum cofactor cytidylyltransferase
MEFGKVATANAAGAILAHGVKFAETVFKKGRMLSVEDVRALVDSYIEHVTVARLGPDDVPEDEAARALALAVSGQHVTTQQAFTGRANVHAAVNGLVVIDVDRVNAINHLHESLTIATLRPHAAVRPKQMLATVKVIPLSLIHI